MTAPAATMTLNSLKSMVRDLVFQGTSDTGLFTDANLEAYVQIAHRELYNFIAHVTPSYLSEISADQSIDSEGLSVADSSIHAEGVSTIIKVEHKSGDTYTLIDPMDAAEVGDSGSSTSTLATANATYRWYMVGEWLYLHPTPAQAETVRLVYVPGPYNLRDASMGITARYPFGGKLAQHHHLVAVRAADIALTKDERSSLHGLYLEMKKEMAEQIRRRHVTHARRVRMSPWED